MRNKSYEKFVVPHKANVHERLLAKGVTMKSCEPKCRQYISNAVSILSREIGTSTSISMRQITNRIR